MVLGGAIGFLGAPAAIFPCLVALVREKKYLWVNLVTIFISSATMLWLYNQSYVSIPTSNGVG